MISAEIDPADLAKLRRTVEEAASKLKLSTRDLIRQSAIFAIQSAARETGPGKAASPSKLAVKYKYREIVKGTPGPLNWFRYRHLRDGWDIVFQTANDISLGTQQKRGLKKLTRSVRVWSKKQRQFVLRIYSGTATGKYDKESRIGRIPHYGAAKAGWLKALGRLPGSKPLKSEGDQWVPNPRISVEQSRDTYGLTIENLVRYVDKISPKASAVAMKKTANRMEYFYRKKIERLERKMNL